MASVIRNVSAVSSRSKRAEALAPTPSCGLAALGAAIPEDADRLRDRLRLAGGEADRLRSAAGALIGLHGIAAPPLFHDLRVLLFNAGREAAHDALALAQAESEAAPSDAAFAAAGRFLIDASEPTLPISGADLLARGVATGRPVGRGAARLPGAVDPSRLPERAGDADALARGGCRRIDAGGTVGRRRGRSLAPSDRTERPPQP